jgi:hypothetical protein
MLLRMSTRIGGDRPRVERGCVGSSMPSALDRGLAQSSVGFHFEPNARVRAPCKSRSRTDVNVTVQSALVNFRVPGVTERA